MPHILVVDDDAGVRSVMAEMLLAEGYSVGEAENGRRALQSCAKQRPDLVLLDLMMPVMNGGDTARAMHATSELAGVPIILISAAADLPQAGRELKAVGVRAFLSKPFDLDALLVLVGHFAPLT